MAEDPLEKLRQICLSLPETSERLSHGEPAWFVREKKTFVTFANHHHDDVLAFWCAAPDGAQETLVTLDPERFFRPPYVGHRGWLGVRLDIHPVDWDQIADLVAAAYRVVAPKKLVAELDAREGRGVLPCSADHPEALARQGDRAAFDRVLAKVPAVPPDPWDRCDAESPTASDGSESSGQGRGAGRPASKSTRR